MALTAYQTGLGFNGGAFFLSPPSVNSSGYQRLPTNTSPYIGSSIPTGAQVTYVAITFTPGSNTWLYSGTTNGTLAIKDSSGNTIVQGGTNTISDSSTGASTVSFQNGFKWPSNTNLTLYGVTGNDYFFRYLQSNTSSDGYMTIAVSVNYTPVTACSPPSACTISPSLAESSATLSWSGAAAGVSNSITGYQIQQSDSTDNSSWGPWVTYTTLPNTGTSGSQTISPLSSRGYYRKYRVQTQGSAGSSYYSAWKESGSVRRNQVPTSPTAFTASPTIWSGGALTLAWSGQSDPDNNLSGVAIEYQVNSGTWVSLGTKTSSPFSYTPSLSSGQMITFRARSVDALSVYADSYKTSNTVSTYAAAGAPTSCALSATLTESTATLSWSGAAAGMQNSITGYEIQYRESSDNSAWSSWTGYGVVASTSTSGSTSVNASPTRGYYRRFRVRAQGSAGSNYYSGWKESSGSVRKNQIPTNPTSFTVSPVVWQSGALTLSWSGHTDPDGNYAGMRIEYQINGVGAWTSIGTLQGGATTYVPPLSIGQTIIFRAQSIDALGAVASAYKLSNIVISNTVPSAPTINYPAANATCYCATPRVLVTIGADAENNSQTLSASGYSPSRTGSLAPGQKVLYKRASALTGDSAQTFSVNATDTGGLTSPPATRAFKYAKPQFSQPTLTAGTKIKAADINELRTMTSNLCAYYGLSAPNWGGAVTANDTPLANWSNHVTAIRNQLTNIANRINGWDTSSTTNRVSLPAWIAIPSNTPTAAVMNQIRAAVALL